MSKIKTLMPSLKERKRYVVFEVKCDTNVEADHLVFAINQACLHALGVIGVGKAGILILKNQIAGTTGIIRVSHTGVDNLRAALGFVTTINNCVGSVHIRGISGSINGAKKKFMTETERKSVVGSYQKRR